MGTTRLALAAALALAGVVATGCGSSSNNGGGPDSSTDSPVTNRDGKTTTDGKTTADGKTGNPDSPINNPDSPGMPDADSGGCVFQTYVATVIYKAAANSTPNTNLGQMCSDDHTTLIDTSSL